MEHLFESLGDLVQAITYAGITLFGFFLFGWLEIGKQPEEDDDEEGK